MDVFHHEESLILQFKALLQITSISTRQELSNCTDTVTDLVECFIRSFKMFLIQFTVDHAFRILFDDHLLLYFSLSFEDRL